MNLLALLIRTWVRSYLPKDGWPRCSYTTAESLTILVTTHKSSTEESPSQQLIVHWLYNLRRGPAGLVCFWCFLSLVSLMNFLNLDKPLASFQMFWFWVNICKTLICYKLFWNGYTWTGKWIRQMEPSKVKWTGRWRCHRITPSHICLLSRSLLKACHVFVKFLLKA